MRRATDVDQPAVRIAVVRAHASTLTLSRIRKHAALVSVGTPDSAFELLRAGRVDAWASARQALVEYSAQSPGWRVLEDRYGTNRAAVVVAKGRAARLPTSASLSKRSRHRGSSRRQSRDRAGTGSASRPWQNHRDRSEMRH
jgi:hypothetical protein